MTGEVNSITFYRKLEKRNKHLPEVAKTYFLNINVPKRHKHDAQNLNKTSLSVKIDQLLKLNDRKFMSFQHMKPFYELISKVSNSISRYNDYLKLQSESNSIHQNTPADTLDKSIEVYPVVKLK